MDSGNAHTALSLLGSLMLFALILVAAWFSVRWLGGQYQLKTAGNHIKVLERIALAPDRSLVIVRQASKCCCWG